MIFLLSATSTKTSVARMKNGTARIASDRSIVTRKPMMMPSTMKNGDIMKMMRDSKSLSLNVRGESTASRTVSQVSAS